MKKLNALVIASITGLALAGGFFFAESASAADYGPHEGYQQEKGQQLHKEKKHVEKNRKQKVNKDKKHQQEMKEEKAQDPQRKLKPWEEKYYEQHPEAREQDAKKGNPEKKNVEDNDGITWHRL